MTGRDLLALALLLGLACGGAPAPGTVTVQNRSHRRIETAVVRAKGIEITLAGIDAGKRKTARFAPTMETGLGILVVFEDGTHMERINLGYFEGGDEPHCVFVVTDDHVELMPWL